VRQRRVMQPYARRVESDRVVLALADVQAEEHLVPVIHARCLSSRRRPVADQASTAGSHVTTRPTFRRPCPYQRSEDATKPGDTTPRIMGKTGGLSHAGPGDRSSL